MRPVAATFYDGKTSQPHEVRLCFDSPGRLPITGLGTELVYPLSAGRITSRVANTPPSPVSFGPVTLCGLLGVQASPSFGS